MLRGTFMASLNWPIRAGNPDAIFLGQRGRLHVDPDAATLQRATVERDSREQRLQAASAQRHEAALTRDGHAVEVFANIGESAGVASAATR